jgi:hypothetical protein
MVAVMFSLHFSDYSASVAVHVPFYLHTKMRLHMAASGIILNCTSLGKMARCALLLFIVMLTAIVVS